MKVAVLATEVRQLQKDRDAGTNKDERASHTVQRLDRRITRIEVQMDLALDALKVPQHKRPIAEQFFHALRFPDPMHTI